MTIGLVTGSVAPGHKDPTLRGIVLLVVQELDLSLSPVGVSFIAADCVCAGRGDLVVVTRGTAALHTDATAGRPIDAAVVAIIDKLEID